MGIKNEPTDKENRVIFRFMREYTGCHSSLRVHSVNSNDRHNVALGVSLEFYNHGFCLTEATVQ